MGICAVAAASCVASADGLAERVVSPDGRTAFSFGLREGVPVVSVTADGKSAFEMTVGLVEGKFSVLDAERRTVDTSWKPVWGVRAEYPDRYGELRVRLANAGEKRPVAALTLRAYDEGFAVRAEAEANVYSLNAIDREATEWRFPKGSAAWCIARTEATFDADPTELSALDPSASWRMPFTLRIPGCGYASVLEANVQSAPRSWLRCEKGVLRPVWAAGTLEGRGWLRSPWRAVVLGRTAGELIERSHLVLNLNDPCAIADTSWIRPGLSECDMGVATLKNDDLVGAIPTMKKLGVRYGQVDWGWYGTEFAWNDDERTTFERIHPELKDLLSNGEWRENTKADPLTAAKGFVPYHPYWPYDCHRHDVDFDPVRIASALRAEGMGLCLYIHGDVLEKHDLDQLFATYASWGVAGLKPGFVSYGSQRATDFLRKLAATAARHRLWLDIHDEHIPDGFERTYPNVMISEGGGGEEGGHPVRQDVVLPFTRCIAGPFDYTPNFFNAKRTHAHAGAMLLVYPGPTAVMRGNPVKAMASDPSLFDFVRALPFDYDETHVLDDRIGHAVAVARRRGSTWYVAGLAGERPADFSHALDFLPQGGTCELRLWRDDSEGDLSSPARFETRRVSAADNLTVRMSVGGGFCAIIAESGLKL